MLVCPLDLDDSYVLGRREETSPLDLAEGLVFSSEPRIPFVGVPL